MSMFQMEGTALRSLAMASGHRTFPFSVWCSMLAVIVTLTPCLSEEVTLWL
jgi:hypothetical protein